MDACHPPRQWMHKVATSYSYTLQSSRMFQKQGDVWAFEVENRLQGCIDLAAAEAINFTIMTVRVSNLCLMKYLMALY